jgi:tRNA modification GTPase
LTRIARDIPLVRVSALTGQGVDELRDAIKDRVINTSGGHTDALLAPNLRHKVAIESASESFRRGAIAVKERMPWEIVAFELKSGLEALGDIIGETTSEEVLEKIFSDFCIGK